jgi:cytochrome P450
MLEPSLQKGGNQMTASVVPSIFRVEKPDRILPSFPSVGGDQLGHIPGRKGLPVLGILPEAVSDPFAFTRKMYQTFGPVHRFYACGNWNVQLVGPEANEFVLFDRDNNFSAYGGWKPVFGRHFDGGLLLRDGANHSWHRKLIAAAFKQDQLQHYLATFATNIAHLGSRCSGTIIDAYEFGQTLTFANGYSAFLGLDAANGTRADLLAFRYLMRSATAVIPFAIPGNAEWRARWAKLHVRKLLAPMIAGHPEHRRTDLAAALVRMKKEDLLDDEEIVAHLTFTIAASFDALSSATVSTLYYLARDPLWQGRVRDELCSKIPSAEHIQLSQLQQCEESEWAVKEALRLNAAAPVLWRRALRDTSFAGFSIPAGTVTGVNPMLTHLLPQIWTEPHQYNPARFAADQARARHRFAFVPFGGGAHGCLGANFASLQVRSLLRHLLERHELVLASKTPPRWYHWPNCRPLGGLPIEFRPLSRSPRQSRSRF